MSIIQPKIGDQWTMNATMLQTHKLEKQKNLVGDPTVIVSNAKGTSRKRKFECVILGARVKGSTTVNPTIEFYAQDAATYGFVAAPAAPVASVEGGLSETAEPAPKRPRAAAEPSDSAAVAPEHPHVGLKLPGGFVVEGTTVRGGARVVSVDVSVEPPMYTLKVSHSTAGEPPPPRAQPSTRPPLPCDRTRELVT